MAGTRSYVDIGAIQRIETGSPSARTSYVDIGAAQRQEATAPPFTQLGTIVLKDKFLPPYQQRYHQRIR